METLNTIFTILQFGFMAIDLILIASFIYLALLAQTFRPDLIPRRPSARASTLSRSVLREQWQAITAHYLDGTQQGYKMAIIEADKFVDYILKESGFQGEHMADRLEKLAPHNLQSFEKLWRAHKVRNEIVHGVGYEVSSGLAERTMKDYEEFLKEVRILF